MFLLTPCKSVQINFIKNVLSLSIENQMMSPFTSIANFSQLQNFLHKLTGSTQNYNWPNKNVVIASIQTKLIATRAACIYCELLYNGMETKCMHLEYMYSILCQTTF